MGVYDYQKRESRILAEESLMDRAEAELTGNAVKVYVEVDAHFYADGRIRPRSLVWEDGRRYEIDRVLKVDRAASRRAGGAGVRYLCRVMGQSVELFYEGEGRWFVSRKNVPQTPAL